MNRYFYIDQEGKQKGPSSIDELKNLQIKKDTQVWTQGMAEWQRAYDVVELQPLFLYRLQLHIMSMWKQHLVSKPHFSKQLHRMYPLCQSRGWWSRYW